MNPLLEQFLLEARENLAFIDQNIEQIGGDDPELLNAVFRAAHTLKGGSGIVGFDAVKNITHHAEDLLDMLRAGKIPFHHSMIESLYNAFDEVMNLIEAAEESGDIVEADEARIEAISQELSALMGKDAQSVAVWDRPFALIEDIERIVNLPMPFLSTLSTFLPFKIETFDEASCQSPQLYAIVFDVDESCMLYGNDPLYALSLLGEKVVGIHSCMGEQSVISVLSGMDDPEGLLLRLQLSAFVYATYDEINDALFNFSDELSFYPLDVATLLGVSEGKGEHELDVLKELYHEVASSLRARNRQAIADKVSKSLQLIGNETLQSTQLKRLYALLGAIETEDLGQLESFFEQLPQGKIYRYAQRAESEETVVQEESAEPSAPESPVEIVMDDLLRAQFEALLAQQLMALERVDESSVTERVGMFLDSYIRPFVPTMPERLENREAMIQWIRGELGLAEAEEKTAVAATLPSEPALSLTPAAPVAPVAVSTGRTAEEKPAEPLSPSVLFSQSAEASEPQERNAAELTKKSVIGKTVKIDQESIDNLMNIVGELLVAKNSLPYLAEGVHSMSGEGIRRAIMEKYTFINRLAEQLQDLIMSMRMLPISYVFDRYPKLVRDISKNLGKKVNLTMEGGETKLDKNMIEMLADPMIHIMRNSLDHGIESPEIRAQKGKNPEGLITLNAYAQSDKILIEIKDDGAGINIDRVVQKVLEKNLLTLDQIDALSDDEKASLVMLPGLSTAETISEYSGRGVGMDVVKKSIENFGGTIRIRTVANKGTTIILSIPVSLAVTSLLHVTMSGVHYGFPMDSVSETVKIDHDDIEYLQNEPFVYIRGEVIPLLFIKSMLNEEALIGKALPIVVLNIKGNRLAVAVNELLGQLDVVQKPLEGIMENHPIFSGTALLGNGQIIMALDPLGMLGISHVLKSERKKAS